MHKTVLLEESVEQLNLKEGAVVVDATLGMGGHTIELAKAVGTSGKVIGIDMDQSAIDGASERIKAECPELAERIIFAKGNFKDIDKIVAEQGFEKVDGILADLGWRIEQINDPEYGLSFRTEARLDMRLGKDIDEEQESAFEIINGWEVADLERLFRELGEERFSKRASLAIESSRQGTEIETTTQLAKIIEEAIGGRYAGKRIHPATKIFQALRIQVNGELNSLNIFLKKGFSSLQKSGRLAVISFHSIEDRIVKKFFKSYAGGCVCPKEFPICRCGNEPKLKLVTRKPITPHAQELDENIRARSAKLRVVEKI